MEMRTIVKHTPKKLSDDEVRKIAYYIRIKAALPDNSNAGLTSVTFNKQQATAMVHTEPPRQVPQIPSASHTYSNTSMANAASCSTIAEDQIYDTAA